MLSNEYSGRKCETCKPAMNFWIMTENLSARCAPEKAFFCCFENQCLMAKERVRIP